MSIFNCPLYNWYNLHTNTHVRHHHWIYHTNPLIPSSLYSIFPFRAKTNNRKKLKLQKKSHFEAAISWQTSALRALLRPPPLRPTGGITIIIIIIIIMLLFPIIPTGFTKTLIPTPLVLKMFPSQPPPLPTLPITLPSLSTPPTTFLLIMLLIITSGLKFCCKFSWLRI